MWSTFLSLRMNNIVRLIGTVLQLIFRTYSSCIMDFKIPTKKNSLLPLHPAPGNHHSTLYFYYLNYFIYFVQVKSSSIALL